MSKKVVKTLINSFGDCLSYDQIKKLINDGANVNEEGPLKETPIFYWEDNDVLQLMIDHGADINHINVYGFNPLFYAKQRDLKRLFIENGAVPCSHALYVKLRSYFSDNQKKVFDCFLSLTTNDNDFFHMCLAYQYNQKNHDKMDIKDMDII